MIVTIDNKAWTIFCFGHWIEPSKRSLTPGEQKVYNMLSVGFKRQNIMDRMNISESRVRGLIRQLEAKGWV